MAQQTVVKSFVKDPDAELVYALDWAYGGPNDAGLDDHGWLQGDTIQTSVWTVPAGLTSLATASDDTTASVKIGGGALGKSYIVTNRITTANGLIEDRSIKLTIQQR